MFEKVTPSHPDKIADRIAGALVDLAYATVRDPKIAVEVLIGHRKCHIIAETSVHLERKAACGIVRRIAGPVSVDYREYRQDARLARNQKFAFRCGDNGIFKGTPVTDEQKALTAMAAELYSIFPFDGKYVLDGERQIVCHSNVPTKALEKMYPGATVNPIGNWSGGLNVDTGAVNRKLGSDMGDSVTGGGLHGKDLSKADVSVNIYAFLKAQETHKPVELCCAIGDDTVDGKPYGEIVELAREYIRTLGGFEKFAEWGLIR